MTLGTTVGPPADICEHLAALDARSRRGDLLATLAETPRPGVDDLAAAVARFPSRSLVTRQDEAWGEHGMGTGEGRSYTVAVGLGGARLRCYDRARSERTLERLRAAQERASTARAAVMLEPAAADDALVRLDVLGLTMAPAPLARSTVKDALERLDRARAGVVREWSGKSRARMVETVSQLDYEAMRVPGTTPGMVTLTYPGDWLAVAGSGKVVKRHLEAFRKRWHRALGFTVRGLWKLEFQRRGAPHVHLYLPVPALVHAACPDGPHGHRATCETFESWLSRTWADVVGATGEERGRHEAAGTGVDFAAVSTYNDAARLAVYFLGHSVKSSDGKEYQHRVPDAWRTPDTGPGRFWGFWGLGRGIVVLDVDGAEWVQLRRVMRRLLAARDRSTAYRRARHDAAAAGYQGAARTCRALATMRPRRRRTLGAGGQMTGGFVLVNDGVRLALDLAHLLHVQRGAAVVSGGYAGWVRDRERKQLELPSTGGGN